MEEGLSEKGREHGSKGGRETSREVVYSQPTIHKLALALETLVLQMTNSEHV